MAKERQRSGKERVMIAGGGIAGLEAALALRDLAAEEVEVEIHDPHREFVFRPFAVGLPYGVAHAFRYDMRRLCKRCGASFEPGGIVAVDTARRLATTRDGEQLPFDHLIVATGARMIWAVPGAVTFWGTAEEGQVGDVVADIRSGALERVVFTMPEGPSWTLPLYELALLGATELGGVPGDGKEIVIATPEDAPLELFGHRVGECMSELLAERAITVFAGVHPIRFEGGRLRLAPGKEVEADAVVSLPRLEGRRISGVPHDDDGFVGVEEHGRVIGQERLYAAGDVTSFPVKQGGIACQQADAAAEAIAAAAGAEIDARPCEPILSGVPRQQGHGRADKLTARYLTPLFDELIAAAQTAPEIGSEAAA